MPGCTRASRSSTPPAARGLHIIPAGTLTFADFRLTTVSASVASITWAGGATPPSGLAGVLAGALSFTTEGRSDSGSIAVTFSAADFNFDFLAANETLTVVYNVTATDNGGVSLTRPVTVTITGTNDAPVLAADASGPHAVTEGLSTTGTLTFTDVDLTDHHTVSTSLASAPTWSGGTTLPSGLAAVLAGALSATTTNSTGSGSGSIAATFSAADSAFDFLAAGQTLTVTYNVMVTDNNGGNSSQPVTITITGTNDGPIAVADTNASDPVVESGVNPGNTPFAGDPTAVGNVLTNDTDVDTPHVLSVAAVAGSAANVGNAVIGIYGSVTISSNGSYTYTLNNADPDTEALSQGQVVTDQFTYTMTDEFGATSSSTLTITIIGTDDAPVVTPGAAAVVSEEGLPNGIPDSLPLSTNSPTATGTITASDVDTGAVLTMTLGTPTTPLTSGGVAIAWTLEDANHTLVGRAGTTPIITVTITDAGVYTVTLTGPVDHPIANQEDILTFSVPVNVSDGQATTPTSLSITIEDDTPTVTANAAVQLDDDALTGGNAGGIVDVNPDTANTTGTLAHSYGADGAGTTLLTTAGAVLPSGFTPTVTDGGRTLTISQIQNGVSVAVLQVQLSDTTSGIYTVTQLHAIDHPAGLDENDLTFTVNYVTTDHDGDTATSSLSINVNDDTPTVTANAAAQLDDDALTGGNAGGIVDVNPDTANTTGTLAHSYGADGAGTTLLTTAGAVLPSGFTPTVTDGGRTLTISQIQNGVSVAVLQVQLSDTTSGIYTVTQLHAIDHPAGLDENNLTFTVNYVTTDHDGDTATSSLSINVNDDTPTVTANAAAQLDDDALTGGNAGGIVDVNPDTANTTGTLAHSYGADGAGTTLLTTAGAVLPSGFTPTVTDGGRTLTISQIQNGVSVAVLQVQLSDTTSGIYTVTQLHAIDHPAGLDENDLTFTVNYVTTDHDGDTATSSLSINVNDDTPTVTANAAAQLDDDALTGGNAGGIVDVNPDTANTTGTLAHSYGADGAGTTLLTTAGAVLPSGFTPTVTDGGRTLTISQIQNGVSVAVLQVQLSDTTSGIYTVTQLHAIDHPAGLDENNLTFTVNYVTTDHDGDTATSSLSINVNDDTPTVTANAAAQLDDDALTGGNAGGIVDVNPDTANTTGTLAHSYGADGAGTTLLTTAGAVLPSGFTPTVTDGGRTLTISQIQNGVSVAVLQVQLSDTTSGIYTVTQLHAIDHPAGLDENNLTFTVNYVTTDHDGDTATSSLSINVNDDTPTVTANAAVQLDDDALTGGNAGGIVDVNPDTANTTGTLAHSYGADGAGTTLLTTAGAVLPSGFTPTVTDGGRTLTISQIQNGVSVAVLQVQLSDTTSGIYTVTQLHAIDHPAGLDENNLTFTVNYVTTDHDGDTATSSLSINVNDDTPVAISPQHAFLPDNATATVTVALDGDGQIDNNVGADQAGTLTFVNITNGDDSGFTSGGDPILLFVAADGTLLEGRTGSASGPLVFTVTLNHNLGGSDTYTVTMLDSVDNGSGVIFTDLSGGKAGNAPFKIITQLGASLELLFTPINASSVSSDSDDVGIAPSQFVDPGQGLRIDFGDFESDPNGFKIDGHSPVNGFQFTIEQISNGAHADVRLRAVDADLDSNFANDTTDAITEIQIYDTSGALVRTFSADGTMAVSGGVIVVDFDEAGGTVLITGLPVAYSVLTKTASGYDRIEITNAGE